jgi:transcriptional regulator with XRE-family HTH domain
MKSLVLAQFDAIGRSYAAARMLAGLDQAQLAKKADISASTVSNLERGNEAREETIASIRKALRRSGVKVTIDAQFGLISVDAIYTNPEEDEQ